MRIGELAERSGLSRDTIRFYERNGLISSAAGDAETNNYRSYSEDTLRWLGFVTGAREAGLSIADLRDIVTATTGATCDAARAVIHQKIAELQAREAQIQLAIAFLRKTVETLESPH